MVPSRQGEQKLQVEWDVAKLSFFNASNSIRQGLLISPYLLKILGD